MINLLIAYRRSTQTLIVCEEFAAHELSRAIAQRADLDLQYAQDHDVEVVVLMGDSSASIRETHGRYFLTAHQLTDRLTRTTERTTSRHRAMRHPVPA